MFTNTPKSQQLPAALGIQAESTYHVSVGRFPLLHTPIVKCLDSSVSLADIICSSELDLFSPSEPIREWSLCPAVFCHALILTQALYQNVAL